MRVKQDNERHPCQVFRASVFSLRAHAPLKSSENVLERNLTYHIMSIVKHNLQHNSPFLKALAKCAIHSEEKKHATLRANGDASVWFIVLIFF